MSSSSESLFYTLSKSIQHRIDKVFDAVLKDGGNRTFNADGDLMVTDVGMGGGSLSETTAGGFIVEDDDEVFHTQIPLALIPAALQYLDLPPDDPEIRSIFRNAASGWSSSSLNVFNEGRNEEYVSRDDWRAVCAVLLEHDIVEDEGLSDSLTRDISGPTDEDDDDSDAYRVPDSDSASSNSNVDEDFFEGASGLTTRREARGRREAGSSSPRFIEAIDPQKLTPRQQQACLDAFALFFPDASSFELPEKKIMMKDIQRVAGLLKEKIKVEEMAEMLEMFSNSPEKSMNLMDFSRMMVTARLL